MEKNTKDCMIYSTDMLGFYTSRGRKIVVSY